MKAGAGRFGVGHASALVRRTSRAVIGLVVFLVFASCDGFVQVRSPTELQGDEVDPVEDAEMFSRSALQSLAEAFGNLSLHSAWFTHEARVGDSFPTRNEFGLRGVGEANINHLWDNWVALHRAIAGAEAVVRALDGATSVHLARAYFTSGWAVLLMAESFCEGTIAESETVPGSRLSTSEMVAAALHRLEHAARIGRQQDGSAEGEAIVAAARAGKARAYLLEGEHALAAAMADSIPAGFVFELPHADDPDHRTRLGNRIWQFSDQRPALVVPPHVRERFDAGDPRVPYDDTGRAAQDGELRLFRQGKFTGWSSPSRLTSGLEARYIAVEARGDRGEMLQFVNERRAAGGTAALDPETSLDELMRELLSQKALDHWLEGKRMGDLRRHGAELPWLLEQGSEFYKPQLGRVGNQVCWPVPSAERWNNPNWP